MFEKLHEASKPVALGAVNFANRCLRHKRNLEHIDTELPPWTSSEHTVEEKRLAVELLKEIEHVEQAPIKSFSHEKVYEYIGQLSDIVLERSYAEARQYRMKQAKRVLEEMRKDPIVSQPPTPNEVTSQATGTER